MSRSRPPVSPVRRGFSLIELIVVIVVVSIAAVALLGVFAGAAKSLGANEDIQTAAQLAQECGEHLLAMRRNPAVGFAGITNTICDALPPPLTGFARSVDVAPLTDSPPCTVTTAGTCKKVVVTIAKGASTPAAVTLMLVNY